MKIKNKAVLALALIMTLGFTGCASKELYNKEVKESLEQRDKDKDKDLGVYKVTQQKGKNNLNITITNPLKEKVILTFPTTQEYEFIVFKGGKEVYKYSKDKAFGEMIVKVEVAAKGKLNYNIDLNSLGLKEGEYKYEFYLAAEELKDLPHKKGTLTIGRIKGNGKPTDNSGIAYFPLKYEVKNEEDKKLIVEVKNQNERPVKLSYSSGQKFDIKFYKDGKLVYTWSQDKLFIQATSEKTLIQGESEIYEVSLEELPLEKGAYSYEFYSTAKELEKTPYLKGKITIK